MGLLENLDPRAHLGTKDLQVLSVFLDREECLGQPALRVAVVIQAYLVQKERWVRWEKGGLRVLLDLLDLLVRLAAQVIQANLDLQERLVPQEPWETEDHLEHRVCKASLDHREFLACLE